MNEKQIIENAYKKYRVIYFLAIFLMLIIFGQIIYIQFIDKDRVTEDDFNKEVTIQATRGSILSADGRPLAFSVPYFELRMDCSVADQLLFNQGIDELSKGLAHLFKNKSADRYKREIISARQRCNRYKKIGDRKLTYNELKYIKTLPIFKEKQYKGGLIIIKSSERHKPYGSLANRTIGYINMDHGGAGLEKSFDYMLTGTDGKRLMRRQLGGKWIQVPGEKLIPAINGYDIQTTIDIDIQEVAELALREQLAKSDKLEGGCAIVMDVQTGAIRAIANMQKNSSGKFVESFNYAIRQSSDPGSTMKLSTLICLLEDGYVTLDSPIDAGNGIWDYHGKKFRDTHRGGYGKLTVLTAFEKSSNISFAKMATRYYENKPMEYLSRLTSMKLGERLNLEISGEGRTKVSSPSDRSWSKISLPQMAIGYEVLLAPIHTLTFYNAVANNGKMMKPYFIENYQKDGKLKTQIKPTVMSNSICSEQTIKTVTYALREVVNNGTAKICKNDRYPIAGKTGTAQILFDGHYKDAHGYKKHQASFCGFFPADNPKISCIVVMFSNKTRGNFYGGSWAGPVFKKIADNIYATHPEWNSPLYRDMIKVADNPHICGGSSSEINSCLASLPNKNLNITTKTKWVKIKYEGDTPLEENLTTEPNLVPDVVNMGLKDALYILENEGYKVKINGSGRVITQNPPAGEYLHNNGLVELHLSKRTS
ncbi:MAG: penicillin-binding protein [Bacteroidales bacterium]